MNNRITTTFVARAGQAIATQGQIEAAMLRTGRAAATQTRQLGAMGNQMKALGTTIRYALAGSIVFGIAGLVGKLDKLQQQLGLISAIAPTAKVSFDKSGGLMGFLNQVEQQAIAARTPVGELNDSVINFLSTVQNAPQDEIARIVGQIGITAKLSQTPTEDLTKAVSTLNIAAGRTNNLKNINSLLREWFHLISTAPGGIAAAPQIAQQLGPLAAVTMGLGRETPEQMFAIASGALKFGATPSVALRGAQYFQQSLFQPTSKQAGTALMAAGLTPRRLKAEGGAAFTLDFLKHLQSLGERGQRISPRDVRKFGALVDANPDTEAALEANQNIPGLNPAQQRFLKRSIGRIHGIRTAVVLLQQLEHHPGVQSIEELMVGYDKLNKGIGEDADELTKAADRFRAQTPLRAAAIALNTFSTQVQTALAPFINIAASPITGAGDFLAKHPHGTKIGVQAAAGGIAVAGLLKLLTGGKFGLSGKLFNKAGQALVASQAVEALGHTGGPQGSSPANPLYVTIVGQLFGGNQSGPGNWKDVLKKGGAGAGAGGAEATAARAVGLSRLTAGVGAAALIALYESKSSQNMGELERKNLISLEKFPSLQKGYAKQYGYAQGKPTLAQKIAISQAFNDTGTVNMDRAWVASSFLDVASGRVPFGRLGEQRQRGVSPLLQKLAQEQVKLGVSNIGDVFKSIDSAFKKQDKVEVTGAVDLGIKIVDPTGKEKDARVHVPLSTVHDGGRVPSSRGKRKSMRVDFTVGGTDIRVGGKP
jgi:hypothetical protein